MILFLSLFWGNKKGPWKRRAFSKSLVPPFASILQRDGCVFCQRVSQRKVLFSGRAVHFRRLGGMPRFFLIQREYLGPEPRPSQKARTYSNSHPKSKPATPLAKISPTSVHGPKSERSRQTNRTAGCPITIRKYRYKNSLGISSRYLL